MLRKTLVFMALALLGCRGPAGPAGEMGATGKTGPAGKNGVDGTDGAMGKTGARGPAGANGVDGTDGLNVKVSTLCQGTATQGGVPMYGLKLSVVEYTNGDVWVSCSVGVPAGEFADSSFYDAKQNGAATHACQVTADDGVSGGFGFWRFALGGGGYAATYNDLSSANDGFVFMFDGVDAVHNGCDIHVL